MRRCSRGPLPDISDGQAIDTVMDLSAGAFRYVDESGERIGVTAKRA